MRLAVIAIAPAPYRGPLFARLARLSTSEMRVFYLHGRDSLRGWTNGPLDYPAEFVPCLTPERCYPLPLLGAVNPTLTRRLAGFRPDALVVYGHSYQSQYQAMRWAARRQVPYFLRCDRNPDSLVFRRDGGPMKMAWVKERVVRYFTNHAAGALTIGTANDRYWEHFGVRSERRFLAPFAVDNEWFGTVADRYRPHRQEIRRSEGLPSGRLLLFAGRLALEKNLAALLRAMQACGPSQVSLLILGSGPQESRLRQEAQRLGLTHVFFRSFESQEEVAKLYAIVDGLILPSLSEGWGLVVNEAMASGLPVLVSRRCGCAIDLVREGRNGYLFDPVDEESIIESLKRFARLTDEEVGAFGDASRGIVAEWNYERAVDGFQRALRSVAAS